VIDQEPLEPHTSSTSTQSSLLPCRTAHNHHHQTT
jgi:hypothetical protein